LELVDEERVILMFGINGYVSDYHIYEEEKIGISREQVCVYKEGMCQEYGTKENMGRNERKEGPK